MDRILSVTLGIMLISSGLSYAQSWGIFGAAPPGAAAVTLAVTPNVIAKAAGCPNATANGGCQTTPPLSFQGTPLFSSVLFVADWIGAMAQFVSTFAAIVPVPGQLLLAYTGGTVGNSLLPVAGMINLACWFDYFLFVVLFLRGGKA